MNSAIVFVVVVILCAGYVFGAGLPPVTSVTDTCLTEYKINPDIYNKNDSSLTNEQLYCPIACVYRSFGIMKPDGTINPSKVQDYFEEDDLEAKRVFFEIHDTCKEGRTHCKLVQCMFGELKNHIGKRPQANDDFDENFIFDK